MAGTDSSEKWSSLGYSQYPCPLQGFKGVQERLKTLAQDILGDVVVRISRTVMIVEAGIGIDFDYRTAGVFK